MRPQEYIANGSSAALSMSNHRGAQTDAACEWLTLEHLAHDSERIGGMVVRSAQVRKVLKTIARLSPYKATVLIGHRQGARRARATHSGPRTERPVRYFQLLEPGRDAG
jgi:DNA-binding NtrC family response regulator